MAKHNRQEPATLEPEAPATETETTEQVQVTDVKDLFRRQINDNTPVTQLRLKRVLTRPLVSMSKTKEFAAECQSEMYLFDMPLTGRKGGNGQMRVIDVRDIEQGVDVILICHEIMCSALKKAGYRTLGFVQDEEKGDSYPEQDGRSLIGIKLAFLGGDIADGKRYRQINVAELE